MGAYKDSGAISGVIGRVSKIFRFGGAEYQITSKMKIYPIVKYMDVIELEKSFIPREPSEKFLKAYKTLIQTFRKGKMEKKKFNQLWIELMVKNGQLYSREEWCEIGLKEAFDYFEHWFKFTKPKKQKDYIEIDADQDFAERYLKGFWNYQ